MTQPAATPATEETPTSPVRWCAACDGTFDQATLTCPVDGERLHLEHRADPYIGRVFQDRFEVIERIGAGAHGAVYRAVQVSMGRPVALKILHAPHANDATATRRFLREARSTSALTHPNTITIHDFGETHDGVLFLAMELLEGVGLREHMHKRGPMRLADAVRIMDQVAASLSEAHAASIVHRDLKPDNVFLARRPQDPEFVKVLDFGIARVREAGGERITRDGTIAGTPEYISPEAVSGKDVGAEGDVYAMGVMLFEMLAGRTPFTGDTSLALLMAHANDSPPDLLDVAPEADAPLPIRRFIDRCLAKKPSSRPADAVAFRRQLRSAVRGSGVHVTLPTDPGLGPLHTGRAGVGTRTALTMPGRRRWIRGVAAGALAAAALFAVWLGVRTPEPTGGDASDTEQVVVDAPQPAVAPPATSRAYPMAPPVAASASAPGAPALTDGPAAEAAPGISAGVAAAQGNPAARVGEPGAGEESVALGETIVLKVDSHPSDAAVYAGDELLGRTPLEVRLAPSADPLEIELRKTGYRRATEQVVLEGDSEVSVRLRRKPRRKRSSAKAPDGSPGGPRRTKIDSLLE